MSRRPPAHLRYAADSQTPPQHRLSLAGHGLIAVLRDLQWLSDDDTVPAIAHDIAWLVRRPVEEITQALMEIMGCGVFEVNETEMFDPQLRTYKLKVKRLSEVRAEAGAQGGSVAKPRKKNEKARPRAIAKANVSPNGQASSTPTPTSTPTRLVEEANSDPWAEDYERALQEPRSASVDKRPTANVISLSTRRSLADLVEAAANVSDALLDLGESKSPGVAAR